MPMAHDRGVVHPLHFLKEHGRDGAQPLSFHTALGRGTTSLFYVPELGYSECSCLSSVEWGGGGKTVVSNGMLQIALSTALICYQEQPEGQRASAPAINHWRGRCILHMHSYILYMLVFKRFSCRIIDCSSGALWNHGGTRLAGQ
jgi:hypothetical protein